MNSVFRWLSGSDLKKVASFGCPSLGKKVVFSAKGLRKFFGIQENTVSYVIDDFLFPSPINDGISFFYLLSRLPLV